jgi:hypothetical protein
MVLAEAQNTRSTQRVKYDWLNLVGCNGRFRTSLCYAAPAHPCAMPFGYYALPLCFLFPRALPTLQKHQKGN